MLTEGRVTEPEYVRQLAGRLGIAGGAIVLEDVPAVDPATLLKRAKELRADNKRAAKRGQEPLVDQWWILSDTEGPRHPHPKIKETAVAARQAGISIAFSDPCFEYWLLLHYVYTTGGELEAKDMVKRLGEFIPGYGVKSKHPELGDATELSDMPALAPLMDERVLEDFSIDRGVLTWLDGEIDIAPEAAYPRSFEYPRPA